MMPSPHVIIWTESCKHKDIACDGSRGTYQRDDGGPVVRAHLLDDHGARPYPQSHHGGGDGQTKHHAKDDERLPVVMEAGNQRRVGQRSDGNVRLTICHVVDSRGGSVQYETEVDKQQNNKRSRPD